MYLGTAIRISHRLFYFTLSITLQARCYWPHFTDEETEGSERISNLSIIHLVKAESHPGVYEYKL